MFFANMFQRSIVHSRRAPLKLSEASGLCVFSLHSCGSSSPSLPHLMSSAVSMVVPGYSTVPVLMAARFRVHQMGTWDN